MKRTHAEFVTLRYRIVNAAPGANLCRKRQGFIKKRQVDRLVAMRRRAVAVQEFLFGNPWKADSPEDHGPVIYAAEGKTVSLSEQRGTQLELQNGEYSHDSNIIPQTH